MQKNLKINSESLTAMENSPDFSRADFSFSAWINERIKQIVLADDNPILSNETIDKLSALCDQYDIEILDDSSGTEDEPGFVINQVILFNEGQKRRKKEHDKQVNADKETKLERSLR